MKSPYFFLIFVSEKCEVGNIYMNLNINSLQSLKGQYFFSAYVSGILLMETFNLNR